MSVKVKRISFSENDSLWENIFDLAKEYQDNYYKECQTVTRIFPLDRYDFSNKFLHDDREDCLSGVISSLESQKEKEYSFDKIMEDEPGMTYIKDSNREKKFSFDDYICSKQPFNLEKL